MRSSSRLDLKEVADAHTGFVSCLSPCFHSTTHLHHPISRWRSERSRSDRLLRFLGSDRLVFLEG
ncbi:MAG: hypothetical protein V8R91_16310 [Butyricimonas faecihominis]